MLADSRYRVQAREECPDARIEDVYNDLPARWPALLASLRAASAAVGHGRVARVAVEARLRQPRDVDPARRRRARMWSWSPAEGWIEELRAGQGAGRDGAHRGRLRRRRCGARNGCCRRIRPGVTERELALALEWELRTHGAEALAFDVACLAGPRAALPHGSPGRPTGGRRRGAPVRLRGAGVRLPVGHDPDAVRGRAAAADLDIYRLVAAAQEAAFDACPRRPRPGEHPDQPGRRRRRTRRHHAARATGDHFGHGLGHGIGLATHEPPSLGRLAPERPLPSPTVFSVEPGVYLDGETGVRIEDLVAVRSGARPL